MSFLKNLLSVGITICTFSIFTNAQTLNIFELNKKLGKGVNMGNMFEAPSENEWGNPFRDDYFQKIAQLGFNHVRIPIRWDVEARTMQVSPYTINPTFLERIKYVIDKALAENLMVIINMHHHDAIFQDPDGVKPRFLSQWNQIATYFKDYDQRLVFEVINEPNTNLVGSKWNIFFRDALTEIRKTNPTRAVLMGIAPWGGLSGVPNLVLPQDDNIIITVHYYDPFTFTHQGAEWVDGSTPWLGTKWENTTLERNEIISSFAFLQAFAKANNKPIHVGEFGAYSKADLDSRVKWSNFLARWFESQGFSWAYWEWSAGFGIYNPVTDQLLTPLANALLNDPMSPAKPQSTITIFEGNFGAGDGWNLSIQPDASATLIRENGNGIVDITKSAIDGWHIQLTKNNIALKQNSRYQVTIKAGATVPASVTNYLGRNASPWDSYSGYKSISLTKGLEEYIYSFVMTSPTDPAARIVFDLGAKESKITIANIKIEEVLDVAVAYKNDISDKVLVFPSPASESISISTQESVRDLKIFNAQGILVKNLKSNFNRQAIDIHELSTGTYFMQVISPKGQALKKFIKM